jgi:hypothetical protein
MGGIEVFVSNKSDILSFKVGFEHISLVTVNHYDIIDTTDSRGLDEVVNYSFTLEFHHTFWLIISQWFKSGTLTSCKNNDFQGLIPL